MEQVPNKRMDSFASLLDDLLLDILCRLPGPSLFYCKLVCQYWKHLINNADINDKLACQTVIGFFFHRKNTQHFTSFTDELPYFDFLHPDCVEVSDCCNGLVLCLWSFAMGYLWVVCNPITRNYKELPKSPCNCARSLEGHVPLAGLAQLCFDLSVSSHFHVIEYLQLAKALEIYSSESNTWLSTEWGWQKGIQTEHGGMRGVFLNGFLHNMVYDYEARDEETSVIIAVVMEGNTWKKIAPPTGKYERPTLHQYQGHLCVCLIDGPRKQRKFSMWILEDYGTNNWTLQHTVVLNNIFRSISTRWVMIHDLIAVHPEWNLVFLAGCKGERIIAYDMDRRKVHVIPTRLFEYRRRRITQEVWYRPSCYLPYVPLLSDSL